MPCYLSPELSGFFKRGIVEIYGTKSDHLGLVATIGSIYGHGMCYGASSVKGHQCRSG
mgnify:CR=1 FL=1